MQQFWIELHLQLRWYWFHRHQLPDQHQRLLAEPLPERR
jgi:hypothetical protein